MLLVESGIGTARRVDTKDGTTRVRGEFARVSRPTQNSRSYPRPVWESNIKRLSKVMESRQWYGELDHPDDNRTRLKRASHVVTKLWLENDIVMGEAIIFRTTNGKNLKAIIDGGGVVGVSSRGFGDLIRDESLGVDVVQENYRLDAFDFVCDPADVDALPQIVSESVQQDADRKYFFEGVDLTAALAEEIEVENAGMSLLRSLTEKKDDAPAAVPQAQATPAGDDAAATIRRLTEENERLCREQRQLECAIVLEHEVLGDADEKVILALLGDVPPTETAESLRARITHIRECLALRAPEALREDVSTTKNLLEARTQQLADTQERLRKIEAERWELVKTLEESAELLEDARLRLVAEQRLASHPKASAIRAIIDMTPLKSESQLDSIIEQFRTSPRNRLNESDLVSIARSIQQISPVGRGLVPSSAEEERRDRARPSTRPEDHVLDDVMTSITEATRRYMPPSIR